MIVFLKTQVIGIATSGSEVQWVLAQIQCDTSSELPSYDAFKTSKNILLYPGSVVKITDPRSSYKLKSDGTWVIQDVGNDYYSKAETDDLLDDKADKATTYTKTETNNLLNGKADKSTTYTKAQVDSIAAGIDFCAVGTTIPANSDLNTYTTKGIYNCGATNAATLANCPVTAGFRLEVVEIAFSSRHQQRLYTQQVAGDSFYIRTEGGSGYGSWYKFTGTVVT